MSDRYPVRKKPRLPSPDFSSGSQRRKVICPDFKPIYIWILRGVEMSMRVGKKIRGSYQQLSLQHQPEVGSDWLQRRDDVIPWTGRRAQNGEGRLNTHVEHSGLFTVRVGSVYKLTARGQVIFSLFI